MTPEEAASRGWRERYSVYWPPHMNEFAVEQAMFLGKDGQHRAKGFMGRKHHFKEAITILFSHENAVEPFQWNPNAEKILDAYFEEGNRWTCIAGHASSSKSVTIAAIAVMDFLMDPENTSCLITSTTLTEGQKRVWAYVENFWYNAGVYFGGADNLPGVLNSSVSVINYIDPVTDRRAKNRGLALIPSGNDSDDKVGISKMVGFKSPRLRLFIDEASHIKWGVVNAAETNLETGGKVDKALGEIDFRVMVTLNPNTKNDTGGRLCCPVSESGREDWKAVDTTKETRWKNKRGVTIRLSGYDSPNVLLAQQGKCQPWEQPWEGLLSLQTLQEQEERLSGPDFQRQFLAIWPETEAIQTIFTDQEIRHHGGHLKVQQRAELVAKIRALDPAWSHDGDGAPMVFLDLVKDEQGRMILEFSHWEDMDQGLDPTKDFVIQLENKVAARLNELKVAGKDFGIDATGAGSSVLAHIKALWPGQDAIGAVFNAVPSDKPVSALDPTPASERYTDLMTEMWMFLKELLMSGQLKNLPQRVIEELCARRYGDNNSRDKKGRITLEETRKMKKRLGRSPDVASSLAIGAHVAKMHYGLVALAKPIHSAPPPPKKASDFDFSRLLPIAQGSYRAKARRFDNLLNAPPSVN